MLKNILALTLAPLSFSAFSASDISTYSKFVPQGWKIFKTTIGDLNHDGQNDTVLVIEENNPENVIANAGLGSAVLNTNPRTLLVLFKTAQGYQLMSKNELLPSENDAESPCLADPLEDDN